MNSKSKFEEWFEYYKIHHSEYPGAEDKIIARKTWDTCKNEVLKLLEEYTVDAENRDEKNWYYITESVK